MFGVSGIAKGGPGRAQAHPNVCCALPLEIYIYTLKETVIYSNKQSNTLLKQSANQIVLSQIIKAGYATVWSSLHFTPI